MKLNNKLTPILTTATMMVALTLSLSAELPDPDGKPADISKPVKVFIIMGQSNTLEMGRVKGDKEGTLEYAVKTEKLYPFMVDDAGNWTKRQDVRNRTAKKRTSEANGTTTTTSIDSTCCWATVTPSFSSFPRRRTTGTTPARSRIPVTDGGDLGQALGQAESDQFADRLVA